DNKERLISLIQKVRMLSRTADNLSNESHAEFKKTAETIHDGLSDLILRNIAFEGYIVNLIDEIIFEIKDIAMLPIQEIFDPLPRMIRDLSKAQGKKINVKFEGGDTKIDRRILEELRDPIIHIIRNAIDHGIETPSERTDSGKPEVGNIKIKASLDVGKHLILDIMDDGRGVDIKRLRDKLLELGILDEQQLQKIDDSDIVQYIFRQDVSTSKEVTTISGRGIGLSIANEVAERYGGFINVYTEAGKGTVFSITIPLFVTNLNIILFKISNNTIYGIPTNNVEAVKRFRADEVKQIEGKTTVDYHGISVSLIPMETILQIPVEPNTDDRHIVALFVRHGDKTIAFRVKEVLHEEEVSLKDLGWNIKRVKNFSGSATIKSGETILILKPPDLIKSALSTGSLASVQQVIKTPKQRKKSVLLVEDSITARTLFKNILESAGYSVTTAIDGIDALAILSGGGFDIVVTDVQMPRMNGFELTAKIRGDMNLYKIPVVLVTGLETRQDKERGMEVGANAYIVKSSFDQSNLLEVIRRLI
ncbi:MAG: response regulator, partial [Thermodesulfovibrionales bacterium]